MKIHPPSMCWDGDRNVKRQARANKTKENVSFPQAFVKWLTRNMKCLIFGEFSLFGVIETIERNSLRTFMATHNSKTSTRDSKRYFLDSKTSLWRVTRKVWSVLRWLKRQGVRINLFFLNHEGNKFTSKNYSNKSAWEDKVSRVSSTFGLSKAFFMQTWQKIQFWTSNVEMFDFSLFCSL